MTSDTDLDTTDKMTFSVKNIPILEGQENYEVFVKVANTWILSHDLDIEAPEGAATRSSGGRDPRTIWDRKQLKACGQLRTRLCELGQDYTENDVTIETMMLTIKDNFELTGDAAYLKASGEFDKIHLDNYKTVDLYNKNFNELLTRIEKFQGVKICRPRAVDKYVNGLGVAFHSWLSSFWNAGNTLLDVPGGKKGVLLRFIMREAVAQEQRMAKHDADVKYTTALAAFQASNAIDQRGPHGNNKRKPDDKWCEVHKWGRHDTEQCLTLHPELEEAFKISNPTGYAARQRKKAKWSTKNNTATNASVLTPAPIPAPTPVSTSSGYLARVVEHDI
jgi:hypothetical protein